jgi:hypothetical protein
MITSIAMVGFFAQVSGAKLVQLELDADVFSSALRDDFVAVCRPARSDFSVIQISSTGVTKKKFTIATTQELLGLDSKGYLVTAGPVINFATEGAGPFPDRDDLPSSVMMSNGAFVTRSGQLARISLSRAAFWIDSLRPPEHILYDPFEEQALGITFDSKRILLRRFPKDAKQWTNVDVTRSNGQPLVGDVRHQGRAILKGGLMLCYARPSEFSDAELANLKWLRPLPKDAKQRRIDAAPVLVAIELSTGLATPLFRLPDVRDNLDTPISEERALGSCSNGTVAIVAWDRSIQLITINEIMKIVPKRAHYAPTEGGKSAYRAAFNAFAACVKGAPGICKDL